MKHKLSKITVYYESCGSGRPLVALHGFTPDHRLMKGCLEPIFKHRKGWKRIYPDLPGMGKTKAEKWPANSDQMLDVVLEFIEKAIPDQHFILAGESYGRYLARAVVHRKHDLVDGLLLICPNIISDRDKRRLPKHTILLQDPQFLSTLKKNSLTNFKSGHVVLTRRVWNRYNKEVLPGLKIADHEFLKEIEKNRAFSFDLEACATAFDKPSLLLAGRQDSAVGYHDA